jgi:toxin YoeB
MEIRLNDDVKKDLSYWKSTKNEKILKRIKELVQFISETPFSGIGKPEPLKHNLSGLWSRRIDNEHSIIYEIKQMPFKFTHLKDIIKKQN